MYTASEGDSSMDEENDLNSGIDSGTGADIDVDSGTGIGLGSGSDIASVVPMDSAQLLRLMEALARTEQELENSENNNSNNSNNSNSESDGALIRSYRRYASHMTRLLTGCGVRGGSNHSSMVVSGKQGIKNIEDMWGFGSNGGVSEDSTSTALGSGYDKHLKALRYPVKFSYYLASNLPLSDEQKLELLMCDSVQQRLR